jgi:hypothetical protein
MPCTVLGYWKYKEQVKPSVLKELNIVEETNRTKSVCVGWVVCIHIITK